MKWIIKDLSKALDEVEREKEIYKKQYLKDNSASMSSAILIESIHTQAEDHIKAAIAQLYILDKHLY